MRGPELAAILSAMPSAPYVVRSSDYLTAIAAQNGTTVDAILADPKNADLKDGHPEILATGDIVFLPSVEQASFSLQPGSSTTFTSETPTVQVNAILLDQDGSPIAGQSVTTDPVVSETPLSTDGDGLLTFSVGIDVSTVDVSVDGTTLQFCLNVGNLDPSDTDTGLASRLRHMGHLGDEDEHVAARPWLSQFVEGLDDDALSRGVAAFQTAQGDTPTGDASDDSVRSAIEDKHGC